MHEFAGDVVDGCAERRRLFRPQDHLTQIKAARAKVLTVGLPKRGGNPVDQDQLTVFQLLVILGLMAAVGITALATHPEAHSKLILTSVVLFSTTICVLNNFFSTSKSKC